MTLKDQAIHTANALENLAQEMDGDIRDVPVRYVLSIKGHAADLRAAAKSEPEPVNAEMLVALKAVVRIADRSTVEFDAARAAISRAEKPEQEDEIEQARRTR